LKDNEDNVRSTICAPGWSFKIQVHGFGRKFSADAQKEKMLNFSFMDLLQEGKVNLKNPDITFWIVEEHGETAQMGAPPKRVLFVREIALGNRGLIDIFNVKKREYIGTTSMDSALSLLVANQAKADAGKFVIDPFTGTGSLLLTSSFFGSITLGGDLDPRVLRGKEGVSVMSNFTQYKLKSRCAGLLINDLSKLNVWRDGELFDAIIGDPPYGVRAGARKVGKKQKQRNKPKPNPDDCTDPHIPQCIPYPIKEVLLDLLRFAAKTLQMKGRLVYWLPTTDEYKDSDVPLHPCLKLIANSEQILTRKIRRRLITMEKVVPYLPEHENIDLEEYNQISEKPNPGHADFAVKYTKDTKRSDDRQV